VGDFSTHKQALVFGINLGFTGAWERVYTKMKQQTIFLIFILIALGACQTIPTTTPAPSLTPTSTPARTPSLTPTPSFELVERYNMSPEAQVYLATALDFMQELSINRDQVDWESVRAGTYQRAHGAQTTPDTYAAIRFAFTHLDQHSFFTTPQMADQSRELREVQPLTDIEGHLIDGRIAYIQVPSTYYYEPQVYANAMQDRIREIDGSQVCGWVVDLRGNAGGSIDPMLAGIGPVLGDGPAFGFQTSDGDERWHYQDGQIGIEFQGEVTFDPRLTSPSEGYVLERPDPPVAVLTDFITASAGEAVAIAFQGRPDTRSFGQPTAGVPTGNLSIRLNDGAVLNITTSYMVDRNGVVYHTIIRPDEMVWDLGLGGDEDPVVQAGVDWLLELEECK
jgi:carboxyl-terminal processing protease